MRYSMTCNYLREVHGIDTVTKTIANRVCAGTGPEVEYLDTIPYCTPEKVDTWVKNRISSVPRTKAGVKAARTADPDTGAGDATTEESPRPPRGL
jgi:hypothetical protein